MTMESLDLAGPGLVFITLPACLSTMYWPNFWMFIFFVTLILIGIDSQFGLTETVTYFLEDLHLKWNGIVISDTFIKLSSCIFIYTIGLPVATQGGQYVLEMLDTFGFALPASCSLLGTAYIWSKHVNNLAQRTNFKSMIAQIVIVTKEKYPTHIVFCQQYLLVPISWVMVFICFYITLKDGIIDQKFSATFMAYGIIILAFIIAPIALFYLRDIEDIENRDPYVLDLKANQLALPIGAEDQYFHAAEKELKELNENNDSPGY